MGSGCPIARRAALCGHARMCALFHLYGIPGLSGVNLSAFPAGILAMSRLVRLNLAYCCFKQLPEAVSVLTALTALDLGRHSADGMQIGGVLDAQALGSVAGFPHLRGLWFHRCSVLFSPSIQAAAEHPRLVFLRLTTPYNASGLSCKALLGFAHVLLQQGRPDVLDLQASQVEGAGYQESQLFLNSLQRMGLMYDDDWFLESDDENAWIAFEG